ncbi:hypothetical protein [Streptomyces sp. NPDC045470]|uniref:hypothetical protein n=1 Tax=Streptomyces sp. NPDC045470 TaxID=3155469 RepID=UPI0033D88AF6
MNFFQSLAAFVRDNPVRVRSAVAALLVLVGQSIPALSNWAGSDTVIDFITFVVVVGLGESASRKVAAKYNPGD